MYKKISELKELSNEELVEEMERAVFNCNDTKKSNKYIDDIKRIIIERLNKISK